MLCILPVAGCVVATASCEVLDDDLDKHASPEQKVDVRLDQVAQILSGIPLSINNLDEVYDAVKASSINGYDEEYTMADLFVNFIGALVFSISGGFYIKHRGEKKSIAEKLIVKVKEEE